MRGAGWSLVAAALGVGALDWVAVGRRNREAEYLLKPLATALLIAAAVAFGPAGRSRFGFVVAALGLSLAGDVLLMLPADAFVQGLGAFLLAHIAYVGAFNRTAPPLGASLIAAAIVAGAGGAMYAVLARGMRRSGQERYRWPVAAYVVAIGAMAVSAAATIGRPDWNARQATLAVAGAGLFMLSDGLIAWSRFVRDFPGNRVAVMATYHLAQAALVVALLA